MVWMKTLIYGKAYSCFPKETGDRRGWELKDQGGKMLEKQCTCMKQAAKDDGAPNISG